MKLGRFAIAAGALGLALGSLPARAQGPMYDRVNVNMPYTVTVGDKTLQPGNYVIQQNRDSGGGSRVLLIYSDNGMKFETSAMTIPALDPNTARDTKVVLHHYGSDYYFDKVWIQGKDYGYEFPVPSSVKDREKERMAEVTVPAQYQSVPATAETTSTDSASTTAQNTAPVTTTPAAPTTPVETAQAPITSTPEPAPTTAQAVPATPAPDTTTMAPANDSNTANRAMPETSAGWLMMLLGGGTLSGLGMAIRRKR